MLIFDDSFEENCNSEAFIDLATAGRHHRLRTIYHKHNLFHRWKHWRDLLLQNKHTVVFQSPRDVMQVSTLSTTVKPGSELADSYGDGIAVPYGQISIDMSPRTDGRLRYCTNTGSIPSKIYIPDGLK